MIEQIKKTGWLAAEIGLLLIVLCLLLRIILGADSGAYIVAVSDNATTFLQAVPPGVSLGVALIVMLYWFAKVRLG